MAPLMAALCDRALSSDEAAELALLLQQSTAIRQRYAEHMAIHAMLVWRHAAPLAGLPPALSGQTRDEEISGEIDEPLALPKIRGGDWRINPRVRYLMYAAAALVLIGISVLPLMRKSGKQSAPVAGQAEPRAAEVATVVSSTEATWAVGAAALGVGARLPVGRLRLNVGEVELRFDSGAQVWLRGPADFDLQSRNRARLESGQLLARVPVEARGFAIDVPGLTVIDLGTEFGLLVDQTGQSQVHVLAGRVEVQTVRPAEKPLQLLAGEARRGDANGAVSPIVVDREMFVPSLQPGRVTFEGRPEAETPMAGLYKGVNFDTDNPFGWGTNLWLGSEALTIHTDSRETQVLTFRLPPGCVLKDLTMQSDKASATVVLSSDGNPDVSFCNVAPEYLAYRTGWSKPASLVTVSVTASEGARALDIKELHFGLP